jgi:hypothetical protein
MLERIYYAVRKKIITSYKFPIFLQFLDIGFYLKNFFNIKKRRRRCLAIVFPGDGMEYHGEFLGRQIWGFQKAVDDAWITAWHEITTIELLVRKL